MYIHPFLAGVLVTIVGEIVGFTIAAIITAIRRVKKYGRK